MQGQGQGNKEGQQGAPQGAMNQGATPAGHAMTNEEAAASGHQDALDKGVAYVEKKFHLGGDSAQETEKISDEIRGFFKKETGKDIPIADKD